MDSHIETHLARRSDALLVALVRHGRTAWNADGRFLGHTDVPLDRVGREQAIALGQRLAGRFDAVYSSPLARARQTADALGPLTAEDGRLMELDQGDLEGLEVADAVERYPAFFRAWQTDPANARVPGGETLAACQVRAVAALVELAADHGPGQRLAIVSHQLVIAGLRCWVEGVPLSAWRQYRVGNTAMSVLSLADGRWGAIPG